MLLGYQAELGNESENTGKRGFTKFDEPQRGFLGGYKTVCGEQIRSLVCLTFCFFSFVFFKAKRRSTSPFFNLGFRISDFGFAPRQKRVL